MRSINQLMPILSVKKHSEVLYSDTGLYFCKTSKKKMESIVLFDLVNLQDEVNEFLYLSNLL